MAGVSAFGFGGTNAHLIVEEWTRQPAPHVRHGDDHPQRPAHLLTLSAQSEASLANLATRYADRLECATPDQLADVCFSAATSRSHFAYRLALPCDDVQKLQQQLRDFPQFDRRSGGSTGHVSSRPHAKIAFLFTGQGSQYVGMAQRLYETQPTFRCVLDQCAEILRPLLNRPLLAVLFGDPGVDPETINQTSYTQPALFAVEYALAKLWESWGIKPAVVLGHSIGEYVAACVAGVFSLEDGLRLIAERGRRMQALPENGLMAVVLAPEAKVMPVLAKYQGQIAVAAFNGPDNIVISGECHAVEDALAAFKAEGIATLLLTVSHAFHSPLVEPMLDGFQRFAASVRFEPPKIPLVSNLFGRVFADGEVPAEDYWRRHTREAVRFADGMKVLTDLGCDVLLEVGPTPSLINMGRKCINASKLLLVPSLKREQDDWQIMLSSLAALYTAGVPIDWRGFDHDYSHCRVELPRYAFESVRHWLEASDDRQRSVFSRISWSTKGNAPHPLLGLRVPSALAMTQFASQLGTYSAPYLKDHRVQGSLVVPGAAYLDMALSAVHQAWGAGNYSLENVTFHQALFLGENDGVPVQLVLSPEVAGQSTFQVFSLATSGTEKAPWTMHASGNVRHAATANADTDRPSWVLDEIRDRCQEPIDAAQYYQDLQERGLKYGPRFRGVERLWRTSGEALGRLHLPEALETGLELYQIHPAFLDAAFHVLGAALPDSRRASHDNKDTYLPVGVRSTRVYAPTEHLAWAHAVFHDTSEANADEIVGDVRILDDEGRLVADVQGLRLRRLGRSSSQDVNERLRDWLYEIRWQDVSLAGDGTDHAAKAQPGAWLILADHGGVGRRLAEQLEQQGESCVVVESTKGNGHNGSVAHGIDAANPEDLRRQLETIVQGGGPRLRGVVHLTSLDIADPADGRHGQLAEAERIGCTSALLLDSGDVAPSGLSTAVAIGHTWRHGYR